MTKIHRYSNTKVLHSRLYTGGPVRYDGPRKGFSTTHLYPVSTNSELPPPPRPLVPSCLDPQTPVVLSYQTESSSPVSPTFFRRLDSFWYHHPSGPVTGCLGVSGPRWEKSRWSTRMTKQEKPRERRGSVVKEKVRTTST